MHSNYGWIEKLVGRPPDFWDLDGVPHWFSIEQDKNYPEHLFGDIYCQRCDRKFRVYLTDLVYTSIGMVELIPGSPPDFDNYTHYKLIDHWHYGDPPNHNCVGDTMNCIDEWELEADSNG